jgi:cold shock protein
VLDYFSNAFLQRMMFLPDSAALQDNTRRFWDVQDKVLDAMQNFANGWFDLDSFSPRTAADDVFVHISAVERAGLRSLNEGQTIDYEIVSNRGKESADNIKVR